MKRLLVVMPSGIYRGGAEEALLQFAREAHHCGLVLTIVFLEPGGLVDRIRALEIETSVIAARRLRHALAYLRAVGHLRKIIREQKPMAVLSWMTKGHLYAGPAAWMEGVPAICFQHGLPDHGIVDRLARMISLKGYLCCSRYVAGLQAAQCRVPALPVRMAADSERIVDAAASTPAELRQQLGLPLEGPLIGIVARLQKWKGIHHFIEAIARVKPRFPAVHAVVVGGEHHLEPGCRQHLEMLIARLELDETVRLAGYQSAAPVWMQAMDMVVHASVGEPFGIVVVEAMMLGKPVIATIPGGPAEVIEDGRDGLLVPSGDANALAAAMIRLLENPELAKSCGERARQTAAEFSVDRYAQSVAGAVEQIVNA